jgi:cytochrome P450
VVATSSFDPADPTFLEDPHPTFDRLRAESGLVRDPLGWSTIRYETSSRAFLDGALIPGIDPLLESLGYGPLWGVKDHTLTDSEGESHQRLRRAVGPWFTARRIGQLREYTRSLVDDCMAAHDPAEPLQVMAQLADLVPALLFCRMAGADPADARMLADWSKALLLVFTATDSMVAPVREAKAKLATYTHDLLAAKRKQPGDDLATAMAQAAASGALEEIDAFNLLEELLSASVDNTANTAGLALHTLAGHPDQWAAVHANPDLVTAAVEECGRFQPAIRHTIKYAIADTVLDETPVAAGEFVTVRIAAAHRDPAVFAAPHTFDITREQSKPQLAFGAGRHYCLGAALGRMEVQEMVAGLTSRWPRAQLCEGAVMSIAASGHVFELPLKRAA